MCRELQTCSSELQTCSSVNAIYCALTDTSEGSEPCSFPYVLFRLTALTHLSFGTKYPSSQQAGPPRLNFRFPVLPAELFQKLRKLQCLQVFSCGVVRLPADISLLTGGPASRYDETVHHA